MGLNLNEKEVISIVGGGGKTTTLFLLAEELRYMKKRVLLTTTTAIFEPEKKYDYYFLNELKRFNPKPGTITIFGEEVKKEKLIGISLDKLECIIQMNLFDYILIEADGAKGKPIKAPADYEPVIPESTTITIGVIGLDCIGKSIESTVHRPELFINITKTNVLEKINEDIINKLILNKNGLFKSGYGRNIILLNKACTKIDVLNGLKIRRILLDSKFNGKVIITDIKKKRFFK